MRALVTGGHGFLGRWVVHLLQDRGDDVVAPERRECDLRSKDVTVALLEKHKPDVVYHLAAVVGGIGANRAQPATFLYDNAIMGLHILEACRRVGVGKLVMVGTTCSYPCNTPTPFREESLWDGYPEPTNAPYGIAKRMLLTAAQAYREQYGLHVVTLIPTNLYGPGDHYDLITSHVIPAIICKVHMAAQEGKDVVPLWGDGSPTRDFLYVGDCAKALIRAGDVYDAPEPLNLGSGREVSICELAGIIAHEMGYVVTFTWDTSQPNGQPRRCLDTTRARDLLGWQATTPLERGIAVTIEELVGFLE